VKWASAASARRIPHVVLDSRALPRHATRYAYVDIDLICRDSVDIKMGIYVNRN